MKNMLYKFMGIFFVVLLGIQFYSMNVQANQTAFMAPEVMDLEKIQIVNAQSMSKVDELWEVDAPTYWFTKKSAGKYIPIISPVDGTVFYLSTDLPFMNSDKKQIKQNYHFSTEGTSYDIYDVKKGKTYYIYVPEEIEDNATIRMFVYPDNVKNIKMETTYFQTGTGKKNYKYFSLKKISLIDFQVLHANSEGKSTIYYLQKKVKGKWKTITEKHKVKGDHMAEIKCCRAPYGLSKGKYRLVTKSAKKGKYWIRPVMRKCKNDGKSSKKKAKRIRNGKDIEGVFTYGDKKVHWYKVKADREICLTFRTSMEPHGVTFTIYKRGLKGPVKTIKLKGKSTYWDWEQYKKSRKYILEDGDGWYYIKVSRGHAKANGWYAIEN